MDPELEVDDKMKDMESLPQNENGTVVPQHVDEKIVPCNGNIVLEDALAERKSGVHLTAEDSEVNIVDCMNSHEVDQLETENDDTAESMSSFSGTVSETENGLMSSDTEVDSYMHGGNMAASLFDGCDRAFQTRRRRLTEHWRRFIHPLMWRCKWIELQLKEFQSQALKYDRELAEIEQRKKFDNESFMAEGLEGKSKPFSCSIPRKKVMKRKKRKRFEEMTDMASYTLQHNLFSYYEIKNAGKDGASMDGDLPFLDMTNKGEDKPAFQDGWMSLLSEDSENGDENILMKLEVLQSRVRTLRSRIDVVVRKHPLKFSYVISSSPEPCDVLASTGNAGSLAEDGERALRSLQPLSLLGSEHHLEDRMPESTVSNHGENGRIDLPSSRVPLDGKEDAGTHNPPAIEETPVVQNLGGKPEDKPQLPMEKKKGKTPTNPRSQAKAPLLQMQYPGKSLPKSRSRPTSNKRKRGKRSGANGWSRRA